MNHIIHVAMILQSYYPRIGGAERQVALLAPLLHERNVDITVITRHYPGLLTFEHINGVPVHRVPCPGPKAVAALIFSLRALLLLNRIKPDIIHAHELLSPTTTAIMAKTIFGQPLVVKTLRGGKLGDIAKIKKRSNAQLWINTICNKVDAFAVISKEIDGELSDIGVDAKKRHKIPNGVDTTLFCPARLQEELRHSLQIASGPVLVFSGRLDPEKRIDMLLSAWKDIRTTLPGATLLLVGDGSDSEKLKKLATPGVIFTGRVDDVLPYLQAADIFILPSETEGLSNSLLEAMSTGLAVISTNVGGSSDVVVDGETGKIIPINDIHALKQAILSLCADPVERKRLGQHAREKIIHEYSLAQTATRLNTLYIKLLEEK